MGFHLNFETGPECIFISSRYGTLGWVKCGSSKAPRCGAKTRKGMPRQALAMANGRCRMHEGCSPGASVGNNTNALKHGLYTKEARERNKRLRELLKMRKEAMEML